MSDVPSTPDDLAEDVVEYIVDEIPLATRKILYVILGIAGAAAGAIAASGFVDGDWHRFLDAFVGLDIAAVAALARANARPAKVVKK